MHTVSAKLVTIVAEPVLEEKLVAELHALGARGHTAVPSRGSGSRGMRASDPPGAGVRIELVVSEAVADRILDHVATRYFPHYAVIALVADVQVVRGEKYV
jgi:nitrogen regulatory protein P-II 2